MIEWVRIGNDILNTAYVQRVHLLSETERRAWAEKHHMPYPKSMAVTIHVQDSAGFTCWDEEAEAVWAWWQRWAPDVMEGSDNPCLTRSHT